MKSRRSQRGSTDRLEDEPEPRAAYGVPAGLTQMVLRTDVSGMPLEWIDYREAARLYHQDQVAYTCGSLLYRLYGGTNARTGHRTMVEVSSIVATVGPHGQSRATRATTTCRR